MTHALDVYVARHCFGTAEAARLATEAAQRLPNINVRVVMLDEVQAADISSVSVTPSYFLDGRLLFLGNPGLDELVAKVASLSRIKEENHE